MNHVTATDKTQLYVEEWGAGRPFRGALAAFKEPTLIIHGSEDKTVPTGASSRAAAKGIEHSTLAGDRQGMGSDGE